MSLMGLSMNVSYQACKTVTISDFMPPIPHKGDDRIQPFILCFIDEVEVYCIMRYFAIFFIQPLQNIGRIHEGKRLTLSRRFVLIRGIGTGFGMRLIFRRTGIPFPGRAAGRHPRRLRRKGFLDSSLFPPGRRQGPGQRDRGRWEAMDSTTSATAWVSSRALK